MGIIVILVGFNLLQFKTNMKKTDEINLHLEKLEHTRDSLAFIQERIDSLVKQQITDYEASKEEIIKKIYIPYSNIPPYARRDSIRAIINVK